MKTRGINHNFAAHCDAPQRLIALPGVSTCHRDAHNYEQQPALVTDLWQVAFPTLSLNSGGYAVPSRNLSSCVHLTHVFLPVCMTAKSGKVRSYACWRAFESRESVLGVLCKCGVASCQEYRGRRKRPQSKRAVKIVLPTHLSETLSPRSQSSSCGRTTPRRTSLPSLAAACDRLSAISAAPANGRVTRLPQSSRKSSTAVACGTSGCAPDREAA